MRSAVRSRWRCAAGEVTSWKGKVTGIIIDDERGPPQPDQPDDGERHERRDRGGHEEEQQDRRAERPEQRLAVDAGARGGSLCSSHARFTHRRHAPSPRLARSGSRRIAPSVSAITVPIAPAPIRMTPSVRSGSTQPNGARRCTRKLPSRTVPPVERRSTVCGPSGRLLASRVTPLAEAARATVPPILAIHGDGEPRRPCRSTARSVPVKGIVSAASGACWRRASRPRHRRAPSPAPAGSASPSRRCGRCGGSGCGRTGAPRSMPGGA